MKTELQQSDREVLAGLVERVTYQNAENGFCVIRVKARGHRDLVTVVGHAAAISAGEWITASGDWTNDRAHGQQFYLLRYRGADHEVIGLAVVSALDEILARRTAEAANIHCPGAVCTVDQLDPDSVPPVLIGRRITADNFIVRKPRAPSVRRRARAATGAASA
jgi:hypothetical protein